MFCTVFGALLQQICTEFSAFFAKSALKAVHFLSDAENCVIFVTVCRSFPRVADNTFDCNRSMENEYRLLPQLDALKFIRICLKFTPVSDLSQKAWIGAAVRNRFLHASESVSLPEDCSLREKLDRFSLPEDHFMYKQLCGGFPKGYVIDVSGMAETRNGFELNAGRIYRLDILLLGSLIPLQPYVVTALQTMLSDGLGDPPVPLMLQEIKVGKPVSLRNFAKRNFTAPVTARLHFKTPVSLFKPSRGQVSSGYQSKLNGFPSFYQWMRTAAYRLATLTLLYTDSRLSEINDSRQWERSVEDLISSASDAWLLDADLKYRTLRSTPKEGADSVYVMSGYMGSLTFSGISPFLVPVLSMMSQLCVGNDVNFGFGRYEIDFVEY